ncbi:Trk system potassium transporter TrkH [Spirochaetia bacterium]|nr:Trk system potassium transporter TrkH [Spirochaetia bacterium]
MKHRLKARLVVLLLGIAALTMLIPLTMAAILRDAVMVRAFALPLCAVMLFALPTAIITRKQPVQFGAADGYLLVFFTWALCCLLGAVPYVLSGCGIGITNAVFESACGFATTGATAIGDIEALPKPLLLWRSLTHWFGGMGIVLLTVALMPLLGIGGFQLIKAEAPGPEKEKVTPKITATAKFLWLAYCGLTAVLIPLYRAGGMNWFDACCHAFSIMASGGISTKNAGLASYNSAFIDGVSTVFMLLAALNFSLYYRLIKGKFRDIFTNSEGRAYLLIFVIATVILSLSLIPVYGTSALRYASYQAASVLSTTGSPAANYEQWPALAQAVIFLLMFAGGCSGSTAGGIKVIRHVVLFKQAANEMRRFIYPRGIFSVQLNQKVGRKDVVYGVAAFIAIYLLVILITTLASAAAGMDILSSFSAALAVTGNIGVGFGAVGPGHNFASFPNYLKWFYSFVMIAGRLELWTVIVLFNPEYWRR